MNTFQKIRRDDLPRRFAGRLGRGVALAALLAAAGAAVADEPEFVKPRGPAVPAITEAPGGGPLPKLWFPVGEMFEYEISWGIIPVGTTYTWSEWIVEDGRLLLAIRMRTLTNKVLSVIYPVDDFVESVIDPETFLPLRFVKKVSEGGNQYDQLTTFDHAAGTATFVSKLDNKISTFPINKDIRDIPSLLFWLRRESFEPGQERQYKVMADEKIYDLTVKAEKVENVRLSRYGRQPSLKVEPVSSFGGVFVRKGRMWLWISRDPRCILTQIAAEIPVASVKLRLIQVTGPGEDFWIKKR